MSARACSGGDATEIQRIHLSSHEPDVGQQGVREESWQPRLALNLAHNDVADVGEGAVEDECTYCSSYFRNRCGGQ